MTRILVVEDEPAIVESLVYLLERDAFRVTSASTLENARSALTPTAPDLIVLDLMLPDGSGFDLITATRQMKPPPAIVVLSSRDGEADRVRALESGADDYVTKPFSPREVVARVRAVLRRLAKSPAAPAEVGPRINRASRRAHFDRNELELTRVEFDLLALFVEAPGRAYARTEIIDHVWGTGFALSDRTIDSHIKSLRRKLVDAGANSEVIETVRGIGYRLVGPESAS